MSRTTAERSGRKRPARAKWNKYVAMMVAIAIVMLYVLPVPVNAVSGPPDAPTATGGLESISVSEFDSGATLKLYLGNNTLQTTVPNVAAATYTFANVEPNSLGYYVTQTVGGLESVNSSFVGVSLRKPAASAGIGYVDVTNVYPGATVKLFTEAGVEVSDSPADLGGGVFRFSGLPARNAYYVEQLFNGVHSEGSNTVTVQPAIPAAPAATGGLESVEASGFTSGATLKLYLGNGTLQTTAPSVASATYTFADVEPNSLGYYVTQTVGGEESVNSNIVGVSLRIPSASAGIGYVDVTNVYPGAAVKLFSRAGAEVSSSPEDQSGGTWRFSGLTARSEYYVVQSINGVESASSSLVMVQPAIPAAPAATGGLESVEASGFTSGATLKLYLGNGTLQTTAPSVTAATYTFADVEPNSLGYYVTQTVGGEESVNSEIVGVSLRKPSASAGIGYVDVTNVYPGAAVKLFTRAGAEVSSSPEDQGSGTWRFSGLTARSEYYVVQSINGVESASSSLVMVQPAIPAAPAATGGLESVEASGFASGATLKLYLGNGTLQTTVPSVASATYTFADAEPNSLGYYVTQTVGGEESVNSDFVGVSLRTPAASAGIGYVDVTNVYPGATVKLFTRSGAEVSSSPEDQGGGTWRFSGLTARSEYYVVQSINGVESVSPSLVTVQPDIPAAPTATGGLETITASGFALGATLKLYLVDGTWKATAPGVTAATYTFDNVVPDSKMYYVTQTVGGEESSNSTFANAILRTPTAIAGIGYVDVINVYPGATLKLHAANGTEVSNSPTDQGGGAWRFSGLTAGERYYVTQSINGVISEGSNLVTLADVPEAPTSVTAVGGNGQAVVAFAAPLHNGGSPITSYVVESSDGSVSKTGSASPITITGLTNGRSYTFTVKAVNAVGSGPSSAASNAVIPTAPTSGETQQTDVIVLINGKAESAGKATTSYRNGQTVTTIAVDPNKLEERLAAAGLNAVVTIPATAKSDVVVGELNGQMIRNMESKQAVLELRTDRATYTLPAEQINIGAIADRFGGQTVSLQDIKVRIEIASPNADTVKVVENAAAKGTFSLVVPPLDFTVSAAYGDKTIEVAKFHAYVERTIAVPEGVDPNKITTGVVVDPDGRVRHVPTKVVVVDGKYYAKVSSLTNSTYGIVWHPVEFADMGEHWAKDSVNDMGSRMVIEGTGSGLYSPDRSVTRAEFAAIVVRGLGLKPEQGTAPFADVKGGDWYAEAVNTARAYGLISGFADGTFRPNASITREEVMVVVAKAMAITGLSAKLPAVQEADAALAPFSDAAEASLWARNAMAEALKSGIVSGRSGAKLAPKASITRAEAAALLQRLLKKSELI